MEVVTISKTDLEDLLDRKLDEKFQLLRSAIHSKGLGPDRKDWLSNDEAMEFLDLSRPTLQRYRNSGILPYSKVGRNVYYRREDVEALLEENIQEVAAS